MLTILPRLSIGVVFGDAGSDVCCPDDRYCYIGTDWAVKCCGKGSICPNSPCAETQYYCNKTVVAEDGSLTYKADCCLRQCDQSTQFRCPDSLGGGCCDVGNECTIATGANACLVTATATTKPPSTTNGTTSTTRVETTSTSSDFPDNSHLTVDDSTRKLKIGLSVGLVSFVGLLCALGIFLLRKRRNAQRTHGNDDIWFKKPELPGDDANPPVLELPEDTLRELPAEVITPELSETVEGRPHELPDSSVKG